MKILNYNDMMKMPNGTLFQTYTYRHGLGSLQVFGGACGSSDFVSAELLPQFTHIETFNNKELEAILKDACKGAASVICFPSGFGRDGLFDTNRHFLVWEDEDRKKFAEWLLDPEKCCNEMNDDPMSFVSAERASTGELL